MTTTFRTSTPLPRPAYLAVALLGMWLLFFDARAAWADPPDWAPAHGRRRHADRDRDRDHGDREREREDRYRDRDDHYRERHEARREGVYVGYSGTRWHSDFGIRLGRCNREAVGAVIGGVAGGAIASNLANGDSRPVAVIAGAIIGAAIGAQVGRDMDRADRACFAQAMELGRPGQHVAWAAPGGADYTVTPDVIYLRNGRKCRNYTTEIVVEGRHERGHGTACQTGAGEWETMH